MTRPAASAGPAGDCGCGQPEPTSAVLVHRDLVPGPASMPPSVFADDRWDLTGGVFEAHTQSRSLDFTDCPPALRPAAKWYCWELINHGAPQPLRGAGTDRLSLPSVCLAFRQLLPFLTWLDTHGITSLDQVTHAELDRYLSDVERSETSRNLKGRYLIEVRRLWCYWDRLPAPMRLPAEPPWDGEDNRGLLDTPRPGRENATRRIHPDTMQPLLLWSLRFVEDFARDITAAFTDYQHLARRGSTRQRHADQPRERRAAGWLHPIVNTWLAGLRDRGGALPGLPRSDGTPEVHWQHLCRVFDCAASAWRPGRRLRELVLDSGLPIAGDAYLDTPITGQLHDQPWRPTPIAFAEAPRLARLLAAACAVTIAYLSGMRPGELLNLQRGCVEHDPVTGLWLIHGRQWKGAVGPDGQKLPHGIQRADPWTVVEPVAQSIEILQRLHPHPLLFPNQLHDRGTRRGPQRRARPAAGVRPHSITEAITELTCWVNQHCDAHGRRAERIPADPQGPITLSRFRRTLAWHVVRRPRGLIAGAIQYGHLHVRLVLGYAGSYDSGFPDDHAYEDWLFRLEQLADRADRLTAGQHVSGPAADTYRHRVHTAGQRFAGRVLTSTRQALDLLGNPLLQVYPGRAMTCVFDAGKALCQTQAAEGDTRRTPDLSDCRPTCRNIAYTDADIADLQTRARQLADIATDPLAPSIRRARDRHELDRIHCVIRRHHQGHATP